MKTTVVGSMPYLPPRADMMSSLWEGGDPFLLSLERSVETQVRAGIDIIADGQTRRGMVELFTIPLAGIRQKARPEIIGDVEWRAPITVSDLLQAKDAAARMAGSLGGGDGRGASGATGGEGGGKQIEVKGIVTGPFTLARSCVNKYYSTARDAAFALAEALNRELRELSRHTGHLQVDEPYFSVEMPDFAGELVARTFDGIGGTRWLHVCGDVSGIAPRLVELPVDVLDHEFAGHPGAADALAGLDFRQALGYGSVRSDDLRVEGVEEIAVRLRRAADMVGPDRVYADPDCGLRHLTPDSARGKLAALAEAASGLG